MNSFNLNQGGFRAAKVFEEKPILDNIPMEQKIEDKRKELINNTEEHLTWQETVSNKTA